MSELDPILEDSIARPDRNEQLAMIRAHRQPTPFEVWLKAKVTSYRIGLSGGYAVVVYYGISAFIAGVPTFNLTAPEWWAPWYGGVLTVTALVALAGSVKESRLFERVEFAGVFLMFLTIASYTAVVLYLAYNEGDNARVAVGALAMFPTIVTAARALYLATQVRK